MTTTCPLKSVDLVKRDPAKRQARFYRLELWPDLFGGVSLAREYGRIGQGGRLHILPFEDEQQARSAFDRIVRQKTRRGYVPVATSATLETSAPGPFMICILRRTHEDRGRRPHQRPRS